MTLGLLFLAVLAFIVLAFGALQGLVRKRRAACLALLGFAGAAAADEGWKPSGPVSFVMHTKPGGGTDVMVRAAAPDGLTLGVKPSAISPRF